DTATSRCSAADSGQSLELEPNAELHRGRHSAGPQSGESQEVRRAPIADRIVEVRAIRHIEDIGEQIDGSTGAPRPIPDAQVELEQPGTGGTVPFALEVRGIRVSAGARIRPVRKRFGEEAVPVWI